MEEELQQSMNRFPEVSEESLNEMRERNVSKNTKKVPPLGWKYDIINLQ